MVFRQNLIISSQPAHDGLRQIKTGLVLSEISGPFQQPQTRHHSVNKYAL